MGVVNMNSLAQCSCRGEALGRRSALQCSSRWEMGWLGRKVSALLYGTVIKRIWKKIILICVYSTGVVYGYHNIPSVDGFKFKLNLVEILGVVTGLLLVFRTQIAYDRYWEGRNLWSKMGSAVGTLARMIWISAKVRDAKDVVEKKTILNLLSAFPLATKHYLRDEYAIEFEEVRHFLSVFPEEVHPRPPEGGGRKAPGGDDSPSFVAPSNVPSIIVYHLGAYMDRLADRKSVDRNVMRILQDNVTELEDILSGLEKILRTPMPLAYSLHLEHCLHIYVMALPFQLVAHMSWYCIPVAGIACFAILGILGIGAEIENPFGYDDNDLPLDDFCEGIINEIRLILTLRLPKADDWMINTKNFPCGHASALNALDMAKGLTVNQVYEMCRQEALRETQRDNATKTPLLAPFLISSGKWDVLKDNHT